MFRKFFLITTVTVCLPSYASADDFTASHASSTISPSDRYEVVQSKLAAKLTFRLDRFCGQVSQLVLAAGGGNVWEPMKVEARPKCKLDGKPHYQLFTSGLAARYTFLLDTDTGITWQLVADKNENSSWELISLP